MPSGNLEYTQLLRSIHVIEKCISANQICHFPRILLNFYEMMVIEEAMACVAAGKRAFAVWAQVGEERKKDAG